MLQVCQILEANRCTGLSESESRTGVMEEAPSKSVGHSALAPPELPCGSRGRQVGDLNRSIIIYSTHSSQKHA
jgi:hypothetical protein